MHCSEQMAHLLLTLTYYSHSQATIYEHKYITIKVQLCGAVHLIKVWLVASKLLNEASREPTIQLLRSQGQISLD